MSKEPKDIPASVRQRLLNLAKQRKHDFQLVLVQYGVERVLHRLSVSPHAHRFVLKGAMLFQVWTGQIHRSTLDVDLHGSGDDNLERLVKLFQELCSKPLDDGLNFLPESIKGQLIREDQRYGGVRIEITAMLDNARIPIQIDIGFGDVITPKAEQVKYPTLLGHTPPLVQAYPMVTAVAEKYEAMVNLGLTNSRMKDFYDTWVLAREFEFDAALLARAIRATFSRRVTTLPTTPPTALTAEFWQDKAKQAQWTAFVHRARPAIPPPPFEQVLTLLHSFLWPINEALSRGQEIKVSWIKGGPWK